MSALVIVLFILVGLVLLIIEFFVIPGVTVVGVAGAIFLALGIFFSYRNFGATGGHIALISTLFVACIMFYVALRANTWNKFALTSQVDSQIVTVDENQIKPGDEGLTVSRLNPMGKAKINEQIVEAHCPGHFIDENTVIEVVKVHKTHIVVKPKK